MLLDNNPCMNWFYCRRKFNRATSRLDCNCL